MVSSCSQRYATELALVLALASCGDAAMDDESVSLDPTTGANPQETDRGTGETSMAIDVDETGEVSTGSADPADGDEAADGGGSSSGEAFVPTPWAWALPTGFPEPKVPQDNPMTREKVELGRHLFYDERLSFNETQSCASCHEQARAFADGEITPRGSTGEMLPRNAQGLSNVAYFYPLTWANPELETLEQQVLVPMLGEEPIELGMAGHEDEILARFADDPDYARLFAEAFPEAGDPFTVPHVARALASFLRSIVSHDSPYDRFLAGDDSALSASAQRGFELFFSERLECHHCHGGFALTASSQHARTPHPPISWTNTGLYNLDDNGAYPFGNRGVYELTFDDRDMGAFRPPSLRNVAVTAPYMHDGSVATLDEVLAIYERGGRLIDEGPRAGDGALNPHKSAFVVGFTLTEQERADVLAFLESLTDESLLTDPQWSNPFASP